MNDILNNDKKNSISKKKFEKLKIIAILLWIIDDLIILAYDISHISILLYIFFIGTIVLVAMVLYIVKNRHNVLNK